MNWIKDRLKEITTLDGAALVIICGAIILLGGIVKMVTGPRLAYGIFTALKGEQ